MPSPQSQESEEPMIPHDIPDRPWQKVGADLFEIAGKDYLVIVDYYSKYPEVMLLCDKTASTVVMHFKSVCARQKISEEFVTDNMPFQSRVL
jgi:hypothetical protein